MVTNESQATAGNKITSARPMTDVTGKPLISFGFWFCHMAPVGSRPVPALDSQAHAASPAAGSTETAPGASPASRPSRGANGLGNRALKNAKFQWPADASTF